MQGKFGVAYTAAQIKAEGLGLRIRRTKIFAVLEVLKGTEVQFRGNLTKVFWYLDQQELAAK